MNDLLNGLFGLGGSGLGFGDEGVSFGLVREVPGWAWLVLGMGAWALCWWSYHRLAGPRPMRTALGVARWTTIMLLLLLAAGPRLIRPNDRVEQDWVAVLLDRSQSMTIADAGDGRTRDGQLRDGLALHDETFAQMATERRLLWLGFDASAYELSRNGVEDLAVPELAEPAGPRTRLGAALDEALRQTAARRLAGVVVLSDGRSSDDVSRAALARIAGEGVGVVVVPLGLENPPGDLAIGEVLTPSEAFTGDAVPVRVRLDRLGEGTTPSGTVQLIDERTNLVLAEQPIGGDGSEASDDRSREILLSVRPEQPESARWAVRLVLDEPDLIPENDRQSVTLELIDRPLRVAYFDGSPRWEYRYLKNLLLREGSIRSSSLLLAAGRRFVQEGEEPLTRLPATLEDWAEFDVIVIGDVRAELFGTGQLESLRRHVAERGAGLLWVAGPRSTPHGWRQSPLEDLLPFRLDPRGGTMPRWDQPVTVMPGDAAASLGVLGGSLASWPDDVADPSSGWSLLRYAQLIALDALKPTAEVVAWVQPLTGDPDDARPLALTMRYGAGQVGFVGTDETWRWRYGRGEQLPERFWVPLVRSLGRQSVGRLDRSASLAVVPSRGVAQQSLRIELRVFDPSLVGGLSGTARAIVRDEADRTIRAEVPLTLEDAGGGAGTGGGGGASVAKLSAAWTPSEPGRFSIEIDDPRLAGLGLKTEVDVFAPNDERQAPEADHALLARLAAAAGERGTIATADGLGEALARLPRFERVLEGEPEIRTLWDRPIALILLVLLLGFEWVGRRLISLS